MEDNENPGNRSSGTTPQFDISWDIEKYHNPHEPPSHWEMRKKFMEKNKHKFPEQRLVCLASTFLNAEIMGCLYNHTTMALIEELSKGIVEEYRDKKRLKVQKVFVKASDAAASKIRAEKTDTSKANQVPIKTASQAREGLERAFAGGSRESLSTVREVEMHQPDFQFPHESCPKNEPKNNKNKNSKEVQKPDIPRECQTCYGNFVLIEDEGANIPARQVIERSTSLCQTSITVKEEVTAKNELVVNIFMKGKQLVSVKDVSAKKARDVAFEAALQKLQEVCYTIKIKNRQYFEKPVGKDFDEFEQLDKSESESSAAQATGETQVEDVISSKALRMMANMGWTGGGLGKAQQGITEPISVQARKKRSGIGVSKKDEKEDEMKPQVVFRKKAAAFLEKYANNDTEKDLVFTTEFSNEERKILHQLAAKYDLKSRSYGKQAGRHLVISKKIEPFTLFRALITPGYKSDKFELLNPTGIVILDD